MSAMPDDNVSEQMEVVVYASSEPPCCDGKTVEDTSDDNILREGYSVQLDNYACVAQASYLGYVYRYLIKKYGPGHFTLRVSKTSRTITNIASTEH